MKNNKQLKTNKKRTGLYLGLGIGLASLAGATAATLAITFKTKDTLNGKVMFKVGNNHEFRTNGSSLTINLSQKTQLVQILPTDTIVSSSDKAVATDFVGWAKASDFSNDSVDISKVLSAIDYVSPATELRAVFKNNVTATGDWHTIKFSKGEEKVILTGNTIVNVLDGTLFQSVNKPGCESQATGGVQKCIGWKKTDGTALTDLTPINGSWEIQPIMSEAATITFKASSTDAGASIIGTAVVTAANGTTFDKINIPKVDYSGCTGEDRIFMGWYKSESSTWPESDKYTGTTQLNGTMNAVARSIMLSDENYVKINAVQPSDTTVTYQGNTEFAIANGEVWGSYNLPNPVASEKKVSGWQYSYVNKATATWTDLKAGDTFTNGSTVYIRPVMTSSITSVRVATEKCSVVAPDCKSKIYAEVYPKESSQDVLWELFEDAAGTTPITDPEYASIDNDGTLTVTSAYASKKSAIYVRATSLYAKTIKSEIAKIDVKYPTEASAQFWTFDETTKIWYRLENLNHTTADIEYYQYGSVTKAKSVARSEFNSPVYIGDSIDIIDNNFLYNCTKFNNSIIPTSNIQIIRDNFLAGCSSYNTSFNDKLIKTVKYIGVNFLFGCTSFNNNGSKEPIYLQNIIEVGEGAFVKCTSFNAPIKFGDSIKTINNGFLYGCSAFNNGDVTLTLPESIDYIGSQFMGMCGSFCQTLQVDCLGSVFPTGQEVNTLSSTSADDPIYKTGFKVVGNGAASFPFKDLNNEGGYYRKVEVDADTIISVNVNEECKYKFKTDYKVGEAFTTENLVLDVKFKKADETTETRKVSKGFITSIQNGHVFTNTDIGEKPLQITYGGVLAGDVFTINVQAQPEPSEYGDPITIDACKSKYSSYESTLIGRIESASSDLAIDVQFKDLITYDTTGETNIGDIKWTITHPDNTQIVSYIPSHAVMNGLSTKYLNIYVALGSTIAFDKLLSAIQTTTGKIVTCYYNSSTKVTTVTGGTKGSADGYFVCSIDENGLITEYHNTLLSDYNKCSFKATYTANPTKLNFIKKFNEVFIENQKSTTEYKTVTFSNDSTVGGLAVTTGNVKYETSDETSESVKYSTISIPGSERQTEILSDYEFSGLNAYNMCDFCNCLVYKYNKSESKTLQYTTEVSDDSKYVVTIYLDGNILKKFSFNQNGYLDELIDADENASINIKITSWNL